ncbi:MAG: hypothetical protein U0794_08600 [Isosphaeraceae bacterium]
MDVVKPQPLSLGRRVVQYVRSRLQRLIVPDYAQWRAEITTSRQSIQASLELGRALALKADLINEKLDALVTQFDAIRRRHEELIEDFASIEALSWDRSALARRLAQLEDRLIALSPEPEAAPDEDDDWPSVRFPGLDRYEQRLRPGTESERNS